MSRRDSFSQRLELFFGAAVLSAHSTVADDKSFRQKDVKFFIDLFLNWFAETDIAFLPSFQNTHVLRYLTGLVKSGLLKENSKKTRPLYRLTRVGILEILEMMTSDKIATSRSQFHFLVYFLTSYGKLLTELIEKEGASFPPGLKIELLALLDVKSIISKEILRTEKKLLKLRNRIDVATKVEKLVEARLGAGASFSDLAQEVESKFPYDMNSVVPLSHLLSSLHPKQRLWEIKVGDTLRRDIIWSSEEKALEAFLMNLKRLLKGYDEFVRRRVE